MLVVKVTDSVGKARSENATVISDNVFGTSGDPVNLKSQLYNCSWGQLNIIPGPIDAEHEEAPGVIEVTIPITLEGNGRATIRNAVTTAVQSKLGFSLPGPYQQVLYVLEKCYVDCGWAAYAYINSWNSVYQGGYYKQVGVQVHEIGHNLNLVRKDEELLFCLYAGTLFHISFFLFLKAHSGGLDGQTYTDHTCLVRRLDV